MTKHYNRNTEKEQRRILRQEQTYCEKIIWQNLRNRQVLGYKFKRQCSVDKYIINFYCPKLNLAIEIDGDVHNQPEQREYDIKRQKYLEKYGITFVRITNEEFLGNPNKAFTRIEDSIKTLVEKPK